MKQNNEYMEGPFGKSFIIAINRNGWPFEDLKYVVDNIDEKRCRKMLRYYCQKYRPKNDILNYIVDKQNGAALGIILEFHEVGSSIQERIVINPALRKVFVRYSSFNKKEELEYLKKVSSQDARAYYSRNKWVMSSEAIIFCAKNHELFSEGWAKEFIAEREDIIN